MKNAIVGQSGGPTAAINASLAGVILSAVAVPEIDCVYGMQNGISGFLEERIVPLNHIGEERDLFDLLCKTPSAYLGSCRFKLPQDENDAVYDKLFSLLEKYNIGYFFYIGGNDSMDTILKLNRCAVARGAEVVFVGVPKTIDNDLPCTDHTPGYGSAAKYIATALREISADSLVYNVHSVTIVEIMGRNAGWLTGAAALARDCGLGPDLIYLPESTFSFAQFDARIREISKMKKNIIVAISEGAKTADGNYVCESVSSGAVDVFGHKYLGGTASVLEAHVRNSFGFKARGVELNVLQRCAGHLLSKTDIDDAIAVGQSAVTAAVSGKTGVMMGFVRGDGDAYRVECVPFSVEEVANREKVVPSSYINDRGDDVTEEFLNYMRPLIMGEITPSYENGVPKFLVLEK